MPRLNLLTFFVFISSALSAQYYSITGIVTNNKLEPLGLASIKVKNSVEGTISKEDGTYKLKLEEGRYEIVYSMVGFKPQTIELVVRKDYVQNILLETDEGKNLDEVVVKGKAKDRSEEIIRNVIRHKDEILSAAGAYTSQVYIKATQYDSSVHKIKNKKVKTDSIKTANNAAFQGMSMAEISLTYDHEKDNRTKEERTGVSKRGNPESLFYLSLTEGDFNLYNNLLKAPALSQVPFLSPVSYGGLAAYKFRMISIKQSGKNKIYTISIKPKELSNVTVEGEITITDSAWAILSSRFVLPGYHIPEYDHFEVRQQYSFVNNTAWLVTKQQFVYFSKRGKGKVSGETLAAYSNFQLNKVFPKKHFGVELSSATKEAYERDSSFWQTIRTEPLSQKEIQFIRYKDSVYRATHSKAFLDSIDKATNKITWKKILFNGLTFYNREKQRTIYIDQAVSIYQPIQFGGTRLQYGGSYSKTFASKKSIWVNSNVSYGLLNHDLNGKISIRHLYNPFSRGHFTANLSKDFQIIFQNDAWINQIKRSNYYLNKGIGIGHEIELVNGLFLYTNLDVSFRSSLSNYKTTNKLDSLLSGLYDYNTNNTPIAFQPYNALYGKIALEYTPKQKYIREPKQKVILGSSWPTFYTIWRKGIPGIIKSKINFDYLEFGIKQEVKLGTAGVSKYTLLTGSFINTKKLEIIDYKFQRRGDPIFFVNPNEAFQSLDSTFPLFKRFYQAHYVHEFNGAVINKVPFLKKLQLREVAGGGFLITPERNLRYAELFAGVERVFKVPFFPLQKIKLGIYVVGSAANNFRNPVQFKFGITSWDKSRNRWF
jgi:Family of unknown function (DUF5686)/CarboxypepD_reg-like domain